MITDNYSHSLLLQGNSKKKSLLNLTINSSSASPQVKRKSVTPWNVQFPPKKLFTNCAHFFYSTSFIAFARKM